MSASAVEGVGSPEGMIVDQDQRVGEQFQRSAPHLARIDRSVIDGSEIHDFVGDELVILVEEQHPELFTGLVRQGGLHKG